MATDSFPRSGREVIPDTKLPNVSDIARRIRFSLSSLLALLTVAAGGAAGIAHRVQSLDAQHAKLQEIEMAGTFPELEEYSAHKRNILEFLGFINSEKQREWSANNNSEIPVEELGKLPDLQKITLSQVTLDIEPTVRDLTSHVKNLRELDLSSTGIQSLDSLLTSEIEYLSLAHTSTLPSIELQKLQRLSSLRVLDLSSVIIDAAALQAIMRNRQLREIRLDGINGFSPDVISFVKNSGWTIVQELVDENKDSANLPNGTFSLTRP